MPDVQETGRAEEVRDRDAEMKMKAKLYADQKRHAAYSDLSPGDKVLVKQNKENKLSTTFANQPYQVVSKEGNSVVVESPEGVQYQRNVTHVKRYLSPSEQLQGGKGEEACEETRGAVQEEYESGPRPKEVQQEPPPRPVRTRQMPKRFEDYVMP